METSFAKEYIEVAGAREERLRAVIIEILRAAYVSHAETDGEANRE